MYPINTVLDTVIKEEPQGGKKYIFTVSNEALQENILGLGYIAIYVDKNNINESINYIVNKSVSGTYISNFVFLLSADKTYNDMLIDQLKQIDIKIDNKAWQIFNNVKENKNITYYNQNLEELKKDIEKYINKCDGKKEDRTGFILQDGTDKILLDKLDYEAFSKYLVEKYSIVRIENVLHYYNNGMYPYLSDDEFDLIVIKETYNSKISQRKEIRVYVKINAPEKKLTNKNYILFDNGVYDIKNKALLELSKEFVFTNRIPHNYNVNADKQEIFENFMKNIACDDEQIIKLLKQAIGYCFYRGNPLGIMFFIVGTGGNGKSTFFELLLYILGRDNVSHLELEDLKKEFELVALRGKILNVADDVDNEYFKKVGVLKKIVTGEIIRAGGKYKDKEPMRFYGKFLLSGNETPKMNDTTNGLARRLRILPFNADFRNNPDTTIQDKLFNEDVAEYVIKICIEELQELLQNKKFVKCDAVDQATLEYNEFNNHILQFANEYYFEIIENSVNTVYEEYYKKFCSENGCKELGKIKFIKKMEEQGYMKQRKATGDRNYIFVQKTLDVIETLDV